MLLDVLCLTRRVAMHLAVVEVVVAAAAAGRGFAMMRMRMMTAAAPLWKRSGKDFLLIAGQSFDACVLVGCAMQIESWL